MTELFFSPQRPFYHSTLLMRLDKIDREVYAQFIVSMFGKYQKQISVEVAKEMLDWTNTHTFYVQQLCNRVFATAIDKVTTDLWKNEARILLEEQEPFFFTLRNMLTKPQWNFLKAIAAEKIVYQPTARAFLAQYNLGTSATVLRSLKTLLDYELVVNTVDAEGKSYYCVYDILFQRWSETIR